MSVSVGFVFFLNVMCLVCLIVSGLHVTNVFFSLGSHNDGRFGFMLDHLKIICKWTIEIYSK